MTDNKSPSISAGALPFLSLISSLAFYLLQSCICQYDWVQPAFRHPYVQVVDPHLDGLTSPACSPILWLSLHACVADA